MSERFATNVSRYHDEFSDTDCASKSRYDIDTIASNERVCSPNRGSAGVSKSHCERGTSGSYRVILSPLILRIKMFGIVNKSA